MYTNITGKPFGETDLRSISCGSCLYLYIIVKDQFEEANVSLPKDLYPLLIVMAPLQVGAFSLRTGLGPSHIKGPS